MFDPKQITSTMLGYAPQFVLARFSSVIMGVIAAYGVLLFFWGQPPFFQRVGELGLVMTVCYWAARGVRYAMMRVITVVEGPDANAAAVTGGPATTPPASAGSGVTQKGGSAPKSSTAAASRPNEKEAKVLD
ncbi:unspecified product [Leptomonas pyrrhocoris]|uniref:Unspecified product n=1 Tax=Leptomonas pyrrhocoris TaxID=157538 RepID=A0A0M9FR35_LEPPY|nr:unspecified product [Leptomonas pyrrhocoris]XP_015652585.1 unspecified product [Leptomonas pyrrhocoris]KPA74145.1 unspecified product [Leptomonas pyrrhocoris]KPA74146.1 unspecified product [Leptomonas pyrrhocoris]|eukprot:XP_015652584.1 unspecified product [Leptomonas pyrrhocoris]